MKDVQAEFEQTNRRWVAALEALRARAVDDPTLAEAVLCFAWALDAKSDEFAKGYRKGREDTKAQIEASMRSALNR